MRRLLQLPAAILTRLLGYPALLVYRAARFVRRSANAARGLPAARPAPRLGGPAAPEPAPNADLTAYPERLAALEARLVERHHAVQEQLRVLNARVADLAGKADRGDLVVRYEADIEHLDRRAANMRRVITLVWRTRAVLGLRVFLAVTGRKRPALPSLPEPGAGARPDRATLSHARAAYTEAAASVGTYVAEVRRRLAALDDTVPGAPDAAEVSPDDTAAIVDELARTRAAHEELAGRMDRLADNLTWLGDHAGTLEVVGDDLEAPAPGPHGESAAHLLDEVEAAIGRLNALAASVDHQLAARSLDRLDDDVGRLETAGLEEQAAAAAELEVARLVEGFPT